MKTSEVIKNIHLCQQNPETEVKEHMLIGEILQRGSNRKDEFLNEGCQEELEGQAPSLPPTELLSPIF